MKVGTIEKGVEEFHIGAADDSKRREREDIHDLGRILLKNHLEDLRRRKKRTGNGSWP